jgi:UDP-N-acetylmuramyl tripeptide synthase
MKNGKTTIFGALAATCGFLGTQSGILGIIGQIGAGLFTFLMGASAKDATTIN